MAIDIIKPKLLPVATSLSGTEFNIIYNPTSERLERVLVSNSGNFINIGNDVFRLLKGYTGSVKNTGVNIEINDILSGGVIRNNNVNLHIISAIYNGGDITNLGTYDSSLGEFTGGNYTIINFLEV